uniref:PGG domain-containing protein n=1 Tax=Quercus lobata TaxID=97700 RepID=A0A7N2RB84_QUELO
MAGQTVPVCNFADSTAGFRLNLLFMTFLVRIMSKLKLNRGFALLSLDRMVDGREKERQEAGEVRVEEIIRKYYEKLARVFLVISTIIASLSFTAAINPPGGYKDKGIVFLRENGNFKKFMLFDLLALGFSSSSIIIHCLAAYLSATRATYPRQLAYLLTFVSILSMILAFWSGK